MSNLAELLKNVSNQIKGLRKRVRRLEQIEAPVSAVIKSEEPSYHYPGKLWVTPPTTDVALLKVRNSANTGWWSFYGDIAPGPPGGAIKDTDGDMITPDDDGAFNLVEGSGNIDVDKTDDHTITFSVTGPAAAAFVAPAFTFGAGHVIGTSGNVVHSDSVVALGITCPDANTVYPLPAGPNRWTLTSAGGTVTITGAVANQVNFEVVPGAGCTWIRGDLDSGAGVISGLHTGVAGESVLIGADSMDLTATPWVGYGAGLDTKLGVYGNIRVERAVYCASNSLALWGVDAGGRPMVHIVDGRGALDGLGGGACRLDVWNANVRHINLDADIGESSYIRGTFLIQDATLPGGLTAHSFDGVTGAVILNEQGLATGHTRIESTGSTNMVYVDAANNRVGILGGAPAHTLDVGGDINAVSGSGYMINDTATNRHVLIGDGTRGVFRALVAADLPAASNIWTKAAANVYTTTANDCVVPNAGTGTIGLTGDRWDNGFFEAIEVTGNATFTGAGTVGITGNDLLVASTVDDLYLRAADVIYLQTSGANTRWIINTDGHLYPGANNTYRLGLSTRRCANVYSVLGNFSGTVTTGALLPHTTNTLDIGVTGTRYRDLWLTRNADIDGTLNVAGNADFGAGVDVTGNITVTGTVDGVDIAAFKTAYDAHTHAVSGNTAAGAAHTHVLSGDTADYSATAAQVFDHSDDSFEYFWIASDISGAGAHWDEAATHAGTHKHGKGTLAAANESTHTHAAGTLATATP